MITKTVSRTSFPSLPQSWSELTWQQLCDCWSVKVRYGDNADVARAAAVLALCRCSVCQQQAAVTAAGEFLYTLRDEDEALYTVTPRELSQMAARSLQWFDYPYGDPGDPEEKDENGKVVKEARQPHRGYVSQMRDALVLSETEVMVGGIYFALPQMACNNLTWQQYRSLQAVAPQLFRDGVTDGDVVALQAQFLAHCLVPAAAPSDHNDVFTPRHIFHYNVERAEQTVSFWEKEMAAVPTLFHICFQCYQTALSYYAATYPLLFSDSDKNNTVKDALQGEVGTINTIMKYAGYAEQQQVYDSNLPFVLDILNTMTKEAKEIEKMNARIKRKH